MDAATRRPARFLLSGNIDGHRTGLGAALQEHGWKIAAAAEVIASSHPQAVIGLSQRDGSFVMLVGGAAGPNHARVIRPPTGTGTGLKADYYDDRAAKTLTGTRLDAQVSFAWDKGLPYPGIVQKKSGRETDGFAVRWTGEIQPFFSEKYQLELAISGYSGARLYIGEKLLIDCWGKGQLAQATIDLEAGTKYPIRIEFEHRNHYDARIQLKWKSSTQYEQIVPRTQLYPPDDGGRAASGDGSLCMEAAAAARVAGRESGS